MSDTIRKKKISELEAAESLQGLYTIGYKEVNGTPTSFKVDLSDVGGDNEATEVSAAGLCWLFKKIKEKFAGALRKEDIRDNLTSMVSYKPLSAKQGLVLKELSDENEEIIASALNALLVVKALASAIAPEYSGARTYAVGELCMYRGVLYKCITAVTTPRTFRAAMWTPTTLYEEMLNLINAA